MLKIKIWKNLLCKNNFESVMVISVSLNIYPIDLQFQKNPNIQ